MGENPYDGWAGLIPSHPDNAALSRRIRRCLLAHGGAGGPGFGDYGAEAACGVAF